MVDVISHSAIDLTGHQIKEAGSAPRTADANHWILWANTSGLVTIDDGGNSDRFDIGGDLHVTGDGEFSAGLIVGFTGAATADTIQIADANFLLDLSGNITRMLFDSGDAFQYDRANNHHLWYIASAITQRLTGFGLAVGTAIQTDGTNTILISDGTAPTHVSGATLLYSTSGEGYWEDDAGNATLQTPHPEELKAKYPTQNPMGFKSTNRYAGETVIYDIHGALAWVSAQAGQEFITTIPLPPDEIRDWDQDQAAMVVESQARRDEITVLNVQALAAWQARKDAWKTGDPVIEDFVPEPVPELYVAKPLPKWIADRKST